MPPPPEVVVEVLEQKGRFHMKAWQNQGDGVILIHI